VSELGEAPCSSFVFSFLLQAASNHRASRQRRNIADHAFLFIMSPFLMAAGILPAKIYLMRLFQKTLQCREKQISGAKALLMVHDFGGVEAPLYAVAHTSSQLSVVKTWLYHDLRVKPLLINKLILARTTGTRGGMGISGLLLLTRSLNRSGTSHCCRNSSLFF